MILMVFIHNFHSKEDVILSKRKTDIEFKQQVENLVGNGYTFIDKYIDSKTKLKVKHNKCGYVYKVAPSSFLNGSQCPRCRKKQISKTETKSDKDFKQRIYSLVGSEYTFLDNYVSAKVKIRVRHNKCGYIYKVTPDSFLHGSRCPKCAIRKRANKKKFTHNYFKSKVKKLVGNEYTVLGEYISSQTRIKIRHNKCGYVYNVLPNDFIRGRRCPKCANKKLAYSKKRGKLSNNEFLTRVYNLVGNEYTVLDHYINMQTKIRIKHNKCGCVFMVSPTNFIYGKKCPICSKQQQISKKDRQFRNKVYNLVGNEYTFLGNYKSSFLKIKVKHNTCGNVYNVTPSHFLNGTRCPYCAKKIRAKKHTLTNDDFRNKVYLLVGKNYMFLEKYQNANHNLKVRHNKCGYVYSVSPHSFFKGSRCPQCVLKRIIKASRLSDKDFKQRVYGLVGNEYTILNKYIDSRTKITVRHNKCGNIYEVVPEMFLMGHRCPACSIRKRRLSNKDFKQRAYGLVGNEYTFLDNYVNTDNKIRVKHNKCGYIYKVTPHRFLKGNRCPKCFGNALISDDEFRGRVYKQVGHEYEFLNKYINMNTKIRVRHNKCGYIYKVTPDSFLQGRRCPKCSLSDSISHGEEKVKKWLNNHNYSYKYGYIMKKLIDKQRLHLDFYLSDINVAIEYDGEQHFQPVTIWQGEKGLKKQQKHDRMKDRYCKDHNIKLIRIKYDENVNDVLDKQLGKISG